MTKKHRTFCKFNGCGRALSGADDSLRLPNGAARGCPFQAVADLTFAEGEYLFHQGDRAKGVFSLTKGLVALERINDLGSRVIIKMLGPGSFFSCADLFADDRHGSSARAVTDTTACFVPADHIIGALKRNSTIGLQLMKRGCEEARENEEAIYRLCSADLGERVLALLDSFACESGEEDPRGNLTFTLPIPWRDFAAMVGTSPEVISRLLRKLADAGRLSYSGRAVTLPSAPHRQRAAG